MNSPDGKRPVFEELTSLETELHRAETRRDRTRLETLLHPSFVEFGTSGSRYSRADVLAELDPNSTAPGIHAENFQIDYLAEGVVLLTYVSEQVDTDGNPHGHALRSSIWVLADADWKMRFHQGTPTSAVHSGQQHFTGLSGMVNDLHESTWKDERTMKDSVIDKVEGAIHDAKGSIKEKVGHATGSPNLEAEGQDEKIAGKIQKKVGDIEKVFEK